MPEDDRTIAYCHSCGGPMDVTAVAPFSNVACPNCGKHTRVKREFGPYTLTRRHAIGGMSMVFVAHDNTLDREVALKILSEEFSADERRIAAFEEEARITASLSHPHIVRVFTTGRAFGRFYIAMELVPGGHFERQIRERGKIPEKEMLPIAIEVAQGLQAAHLAGLIHRDVKPGNILLDSDGHAKLVDFGLALVTQGGTATATELWATPYYVPPETIEGLAEDFRSDIYAFGATLYHALSGVPSCNEESMATDILREKKRHVKRLEDVDPTISAETCRLVNKSMAYMPGDRFSDYGELISKLETALAHLKAGTARPPESKSKLRAARKRRERKALAVGVAAIAVLGVGGVWLANRKPADPPQPVVQTDTEVVAPPVVDNGSSDIARNYREARAAVESGEYGTAAARFMDLLRNPKVQEPTRTWAGVEATLAGFLDGNPKVARGYAREAVEHAGSVPEGTPGIGRELVKSLERIHQLKPLPAMKSGSGPGFVVGNMIAGLKNWEQGLLDQAAKCFTAARDAETGAGEDWLRVYQRIAGDYLADRKALAGPLFENLPASPEACEQTTNELNAVLATLRTRGRARFNVRAWQLDIARHAKLLETSPDHKNEAPARPAASTDELLARISEMTSQYRFAEVVSLLKSDAAEALPAGTRPSLLAMEESALNFLSDLEHDLQKSPLETDIELTDHTKAKMVSCVKPGEIEVKLADGSTRMCGWDAFPADALIALHRELVKNPGSELERLRRHECAIAFDWLVGNRDRAATAAATLSQGSDSFKERWDSMSSGFPR
ncbi:MAG: serine/threonine protein kinase [Akkermansiaceae bacterium]|nr:serine/threonine protein kinase [Akkermansiaceae bacterium]MCP5545086.1 serine/threonine protein kinase [Akkermansiaceae bacterium]MCP5549163.1 serine/threonine protein kinase [Akkermansiaceae bacterium]